MVYQLILLRLPSKDAQDRTVSYYLYPHLNQAVLISCLCRSISFLTGIGVWPDGALRTLSWLSHHPTLFPSIWFKVQSNGLAEQVPQCPSVLIYDLSSRLPSASHAGLLALCAYCLLCLEPASLGLDLLPSKRSKRDSSSSL